MLREIGRVFFDRGHRLRNRDADDRLRPDPPFPPISESETVVKGCKELTEKISSPGRRSLPVKPADDQPGCHRPPDPGQSLGPGCVRGAGISDRLVIWVRERKAVALIDKGNGLYLVDGEGAPFKRLETGEESDLPVLTGCIRGGIIDEGLVKKSLTLLSDIKGIKDGPEIGMVSEIHGNETFGLSLFTDTGLCLQLGFDGYENKLKRLIPVMADLDRMNLKTGFLLIDLSNPAKINVQRRNILEPAGPKRPAGAGNGFRM